MQPLYDISTRKDIHLMPRGGGGGERLQIKLQSELESALTFKP